MHMVYTKEVINKTTLTARHTNTIPRTFENQLHPITLLSQETHQEDSGDEIEIAIAKVSFYDDIVHALQNTTRNSSGDEIANVNFLYDDIVQYTQ